MPTRPLDGLHALIVEDEYFLADDLKRLLVANGAEAVCLSGSLDDALARARQSEFQIALLEIELRGQLAFPIADELIRRGKPFAFVTGYGTAAIPPRFREVPCWRKPTDDAAVIAGIDRLRKQARTDL